MPTPPSVQVGNGLLLIDPQNDFDLGSALPVACCDAVLPMLKAWSAAAARPGAAIMEDHDSA